MYQNAILTGILIHALLYEYINYPNLSNSSTDTYLKWLWLAVCKFCLCTFFKEIDPKIILRHSYEQQENPTHFFFSVFPVFSK